MKSEIKLRKLSANLLVSAAFLYCVELQARAETGNQIQFTTIVVSTSFAAASGDVTPTQAQLNPGQTTSFSITPKPGYIIYSASGCSGSLSGNIYTTGAVSVNCTVSVSFRPNPVQYTVSANKSYGGTLSPASATVPSGGFTSFQLNPKAGYKLQSISGCGGTLSGATFTTGFITSACTITPVFLAGEKLVYLHTDILGSTVAETDISGNVIKRTEYKPFGESKDN